MSENLEVTTPLGSVKTDSANNVVTLVTCIVVCASAWSLWAHGVDIKEGAATIAAQLRVDNAANAQAIKDSNNATRELTQALRESNCLAVQTKKDAVAADFCKRLAR